MFPEPSPLTVEEIGPRFRSWSVNFVMCAEQARLYLGPQVGSNTDEGRSFAPSGANTTTDVEESISTIVPPDQMNGILQKYPNVPSLGCPFDTGDFQLDPVQTGVFASLGTQNKRVSAIVGDVVMAA